MTKVAIITGGTSGIGLATSKKFLQEGFNVVVASRKPENLDQLSKIGGQVKFVACDISNATEVQALVNQTIQTFGQIDVVANVAGILGNHTPFIETDLENIRRVLDVNLMGTINIDQKVGAQMVKQGFGTIVNVGSIDGFMTNYESIGYMASKGGVRMVTAAVARELAPHGVRVVSVAPAWVDTGMVIPSAKKYGATLHMKGRIIKPEEIAGAIWLATLPEASAINGTTIMADDGYTMFKGTDLPQ